MNTLINHYIMTWIYTFRFELFQRKVLYKYLLLLVQYSAVDDYDELLQRKALYKYLLLLSVQYSAVDDYDELFQRKALYKYLLLL